MQETVHAIFVKLAPCRSLQSLIGIDCEGRLLVIRQELVEAFAFDKGPALTIAAEEVAVVGSMQLGNKAHMPSLLRVSQQWILPVKLGEDLQMPLDFAPLEWRGYPGHRS